MKLKNEMNNESGEVHKLQQHLTLLREQYVRLQDKCTSLEQKLSVVSSVDNQDTFLGKLQKFVTSLHGKEDYSDLVIQLCVSDVPAHKFVLAARGSSWGVVSLTEVKSLDWREFDEDVGPMLLKWIYTDAVDLKNYQITKNLIHAASKFKLKALVNKCEEALIGDITVRNCVQLYTVAEDVGAERLKNHCSTLISTHWNDFTPDDFIHMSAPLLYAMFKSKTKFLLHASVRLRREDVLFLYLIEFDSLLPGVLNEIDDTDRLALDLALEGGHDGICQTLLKHRASVDATDSSGKSLLHLAIEREDSQAASLLVETGANVNAAEPSRGRSPLHLIAVSKGNSEVGQSLTEVAKMMLDKGADPNLQDLHKKSPLHLAIEQKKSLFFELLVDRPDLKLDLKDDLGLPPLWYALSASSQIFDEHSFASALVQKGALVDEKLKDGNTLLHMTSNLQLEEAGLFLTASKASPHLCNYKGESPLHIACTENIPSLTSSLLKAGADPNLQTFPPSPAHSVSENDVSSNPFGNGEENGNHTDNELFAETPLHRAVRYRNVDVVSAILNHKDFVIANPSLRLEVPSFDILDSDGLTSLGVAIMKDQLPMAKLLLQHGADVNSIDGEGRSLLHRILLNPSYNTASLAKFIVSNGADTNLRTFQGFSPLDICIQNHLPQVVESLCEKGVDLEAKSSVSADPSLWVALESNQQDIARIMVKYNVDLDGWAAGPERCLQTLLHRAIDENREDIACFLVENGCSVNALRKEGPGGRGSEVAADQQTPLHMCCSWGLLETANSLLRHGAHVNAKDAEGNTPLHLALINSHSSLIEALFHVPSLDFSAKDNNGRTPFSVAVLNKNIKAAQSILHKYPVAAEEYNAKGFTFLHTAIHKSDFEAVLFMLSIHVNLGCRTRDDRQFTPLHLATVQGDEMIVRNLLLAGANVNELTLQKQTCLHLCSALDRPQLAAIFLENGVDADALDADMNNALHVAVKEGHISMVRVLMTKSSINAGAINLRGQNPLHILGSCPKDNAAAIVQLFLENIPEFPLDTCDVDGNTPLLLAYIRGSGQLCRVLVRSGACLAIPNKQGIHLFNYEVATKTLLKRLLDAVAVEPPWGEGDFCLECETKFGLATRKHHCRHCGRILCAKCSGKDVPILKFDIKKPVRVCQMCFDVLTLGPS